MYTTPSISSAFLRLGIASYRRSNSARLSRSPGSRGGTMLSGLGEVPFSETVDIVGPPFRYLDNFPHSACKSSLPAIRPGRRFRVRRFSTNELYLF